MKLNTRKSKKINKKKRLSRKKNKTRQVSKRLKNMRKKTQRGGANTVAKTDRCSKLLSYINDPNPNYLAVDDHYKNSDKNPYVLSNLIAAIVTNCSKRKKLDIKPLILLDKDITGSKYTANIKDKLDNLIIAIAKWLKKQEPGNEDTEDTENNSNATCEDGPIQHYNEIVHNLKTQWFSFNNVNIETSEIKNEFKEVIEYLFNNKSTPNNYQKLKDEPDENNIKCIFIKIYGKILLDEFYKLNSGEKTYKDINWHKGPKIAQSAGANNNNLKSKGRIMGFGYKIAQNMLYGKLPGQEEKIEGSYDLWFNEIDTNQKLLNDLNNNSIIKQAYKTIHGTQKVNNLNAEDEEV